MEAIKANWKIIIVTILISVLGVKLVGDIVSIVFPQATAISSEVVKVLVGDVIDEKLKTIIDTVESIEKKVSNGSDYPVILLSMEMSDCRTAEDVDNKIDFYEENGWTAQLAAMKFLSNSADAREKLENYIIYNEVYKALLVRAMSY